MVEEVHKVLHSTAVQQWCGGDNFAVKGGAEITLTSKQEATSQEEGNIQALGRLEHETWRDVNSVNSVNNMNSVNIIKVSIVSTLSRMSTVSTFSRASAVSRVSVI